MGYQQPVDHLALWRGIDDAIWREATRTAPAEPRLAIRLMGGAERRPVERPATPAPVKVAEPA
jgi:hypothetical protein